ncbi:MarR family transcriptional regulator [Streptomyces griseoviridis]|uniref:MarR family transcriptional regulator n=2 Tax=Streptomyces TaxID=1883 RepID=A0A3S9ZAX9_STRGD|nr:MULTISPECIES: MarR family transcriptional regulator [Streptomyces]AZS84982.1 MarR family transcriptional regulator [Streptomyces griseoviridis]MDT0471749.1 MarR family transcriptional regulator [Streptomyces sp. DSM 41014]QCN88167.1 MarR family transcriptional regulator [Streptomyces griseoviridis]
MDDRQLNEELYDCLFAIRTQVQGELKELARDAGLTDTQADALWRLSRGREMTARRLAELLQCDASTATAMIDRLERRGLVRRVPHPTDRRAKVIQLTPEGCALRDRVIQHTTEHSPFAHLDRESRQRLHALLREVIDGARPTGEATGVKGTEKKERR